jgi:hypothetical protein
VSDTTHEALRTRGNKGDSFDDIICELLCEVGQMQYPDYIVEAQKFVEGGKVSKEADNQ